MEVKVPVSLENTSETSLKTKLQVVLIARNSRFIQRMNQVQRQERKTNNNYSPSLRAKLTGGKQFSRSFLPRLHTRVSCHCAVLTEEDLGRVPHMRKFSRT